MSISESDWERIEELKQKLIDRYFEMVLKEVKAICDQEKSRPQDRFDEIYTMMQMRNNEMTRSVMGLFRARADLQIKSIHDLSLINAEDIDGFSDEMRSTLGYGSCSKCGCEAYDEDYNSKLCRNCKHHYREHW